MHEDRRVRMINEAATHPFISAEHHPNISGAIETIIAREDDIQNKVDGILTIINLIAFELKLKPGPAEKFTVHVK